jgi:hypothetical protein
MHGLGNEYFYHNGFHPNLIKPALVYINCGPSKILFVAITLQQFKAILASLNAELKTSGGKDPM